MEEEFVEKFKNNKSFFENLSGGSAFSSKGNEKMDLSRIATYEEVKNLPNHPEKLLIDVREPHELAETGEIPTAINIPCKKAI
jgi:3-mercaptopyruvate sulfurtransferase SseA